MLIRKTVLVLVLAFALLSLGLQASVLAPAVATGGVNLLDKYSSIPLMAEAKAILTSKGMEAKGYHLPNGKFNGAPMILKEGTPLDPQPVERTQKALAIVFDFAPNPDDATDICPGTDTYDPVPESYFWDLMFGETYDPYELDDFSGYASLGGIDAPTDRTLKNYLFEVSDGWINDFTGTVVRVTLRNPYSYYAIGKTYFGYPNANADYTMALIIADAVQAADEAGVDFSDFAAEGETLDNVFLIHAGTGAEFTGQADIIWSHSWDFGSAYCYNQYVQTGDSAWLTSDQLYEDACKMLEYDGVYVNDYSTEPEVGGDITGAIGPPLADPYPPYVGVYAHEYSHVLGAPDEYDYGYESEGTGIYSLMSSGSWTRYPNAPQYSGNTPTMLDAWNRLLLGFKTPIATITARGTDEEVTLAPASTGGGIVKIVVPNTNGSEYFLVENRQQVGFDEGLFRRNSDGAEVYGLAIYHIDENVLARNFHRSSEAPATSNRTQWNMSVDKANGEWHYGVSILQADGLWLLERNLAWFGPNQLYKEGGAFTPKTYPASSSYYTNFAAYSKSKSPNYSGVFVKSIVQNDDGSMTFHAGIE